MYDRTGSLEDSEELAGEKFNDLYEYYRSMYKKVEEEDVVQFEVWPLARGHTVCAIRKTYVA